jgi:hypothetical protein
MTRFTALAPGCGRAMANTCYRMGRAIKAGRVWTNCYHAYPAHAAFGGYKQSGIGRENHKMMLDHYQQTKNMLVSYSAKKLGLLLIPVGMPGRPPQPRHPPCHLSHHHFSGVYGMAKTMKAAVVREFGKPLSIDEVPIPEPGPGMIQVNSGLGRVPYRPARRRRRLAGQAQPALHSGA